MKPKYVHQDFSDCLKKRMYGVYWITCKQGCREGVKVGARGTGSGP